MTDDLIISPENEQAAIAYTLRHPADFPELYDIIKPVDFGWDCYKWAWAAFKELHDRGLGIDGVTLGDELERAGHLKEFCLPGPKQFFGRAAISQIRDVETSKSGTGYAENVLDYSHKRQIDHWLTQAHNHTHNGRRAPEIVADLQTCFDQLNLHPRMERGTCVSCTSEEVEAEARERAKNPCDVWGIPYAWPYLSILTGGKQPGELTIVAGEPGVGKSWISMQDALQTALAGIPVYYWSGEMRKKQLTRRFMALLGVDSRRMRSGLMRNEDWDTLQVAKETLANIPLYLDDNPLNLDEITGVLKREKESHGIQQAIIDYSLLVQKAGANEIERSGNVSREVKIACNNLELAGILIASVNKMGMDSTSETANKSNVRGSGQQIHDCDNLMILTKFSKTADPEEVYINPDRWEYIVSLHISKGRELDFHLPGGVIHYERIEGTPKFKELKEVNSLPSWLAHKEAMIDQMHERQDL